MFILAAPQQRLPRTHRRVSGWSTVVGDEELIILEDHAREKIGFFKVPVEGQVVR